MSKSIAIIVPAYNESDCVKPFVEELHRVFFTSKNLKHFDYKVVFVDDGSTDDTLIKIKQIKRKYNFVNYVSFSRNFGKEAAVYAGLYESYRNLNTEYYVLMDADLQDPPNLLSRMIDILSSDESLSRVATRRSTRKGEPPIRSFFAKLFYKLMNRVSQVELVDGARDYQLMKKNYVVSLLECGEYNRFLKGLSQWVGFKTEGLEYENIERENGTTKGSFWGLLGYSIEGMVAFSTGPLKIISVLGLILSFVSLIILFIVFFRALLNGDPVAGGPSLVCVILVLGSLLLTSIGILGLYFEKVYMEVKKRPIYVIESKHLD